jgi:hypothetical protein
MFKRGQIPAGGSTVRQESLDFHPQELAHAALHLDRDVLIM